MKKLPYLVLLLCIRQATHIEAVKQKKQLNLKNSSLVSRSPIVTIKVNSAWMESTWPIEINEADCEKINTHKFLIVFGWNEDKLYLELHQLERTQGTLSYTALLHTTLAVEDIESDGTQELLEQFEQDLATKHYSNSFTFKKYMAKKQYHTLGFVVLPDTAPYGMHRNISFLSVEAIKKEVATHQFTITEQQNTQTEEIPTIPAEETNPTKAVLEESQQDIPAPLKSPAETFIQSIAQKPVAPKKPALPVIIEKEKKNSLNELYLRITENLYHVTLELHGTDPQDSVVLTEKFDTYYDTQNKARNTPMYIATAIYNRFLRKVYGSYKESYDTIFAYNNTYHIPIVHINQKINTTTTYTTYGTSAFLDTMMHLVTQAVKPYIAKKKKKVALGAFTAHQALAYKKV